MKIQAMSENFKMPVAATAYSGGYDIFMPTAGIVFPKQESLSVLLGFAAAVPIGFVALLLPRSSSGNKQGLNLSNVVGVIDSDYRGEWIACMRCIYNRPIEWEQGDRLLQFLLVPISAFELTLVDTLDTTVRGTGGLGSTGKAA